MADVVTASSSRGLKPKIKKKKKLPNRVTFIESQMHLPLPDRSTDFLSLVPFLQIPIYCPLTECNERMPSTLIMTHYMQSHSNYGATLKEVFAREKSIFQINPTKLKIKNNVCIGMIAYGGDCNDPGVNRYNKVTAQYQRFMVHLPVFIMASRTKKICLSKSDNQKVLTFNPTTDIHQKNYVFWLSTLDKSQCGKCYLAISDNELNLTRGNLVNMRSLESTQMANEIIKEDNTFLLLRNEEMQTISAENTKKIILEVVIDSKRQKKSS